MNDKSIDGLRRKGSSERKVKVTVKAPAAKQQVNKVPVKTTDDSRRDEEIRVFLSSVKDDDPTNLVSELPDKDEAPKKQRKHRRENQRIEKKERTKKQRVIRIVLRVFGVIVLLAIIAGVFLYVQGNDLVSRITGGGSLWGLITADPDVPLETDPSSGRTNVLVFGTSGYSMETPAPNNGWLTDSMMMVSIDQDSGDMRAISLPRDLKVPTCNSSSKLNEIYQCEYLKKANKGTTEGEQLASRALADMFEKVLGVEIQYTVHVNWQAVVQIVDILGGIDVAFVYQGTSWTGDEVAIETTHKNGLRDYYDARKQKWGIDFKNGEVYHLNGEQALGVARSRNSSGGYGAAGGNFSREQFQQKIITAVITKARQKNYAADFFAAMGVKDAVGDNVRMSFKDTELKTLFRLGGSIDIAGLKSIPVNEKDDGTALMHGKCGGTLSYVCPVAGVGNYTAIHAYVKQKLSSDPLVSEGAKVAVMNATSASGVASTEGAKLEEKGFVVTTQTNAPTAMQGTIKGVVVYQLNKSMSGTAEALKKLYGNDVVTTTIPADLTKVSADFVVMLGDGYATGGNTAAE